MGMLYATAVQQLIQELLTARGRYSAYAQRDGTILRAKRWEAFRQRESCVEPAPEMSAETPDPKLLSPKTPSPASRSLTMSQLATNRAFNLDNIDPALYHEFEMRKKRIAEDKKWTEEFQSLMHRLSGGADEYRLNGALVATHYPNGNLNVSRLEADHPDVVQRFTRPTVKNEFDRTSFAQEEPELFAAYRAKVWLVKDGVSINPGN